LHTRTHALLALLILTIINFLNYIDRNIIFAVFPLIKKDLLLSDKQLGFIGSSFVIVYLLISPIFGRLGDILPRKWIIALGVGLWSFSTAGASLVENYRQLLLARSLVGIGEASYAVIAPSLISDYFRKEQRGKALSFFAIALPLGSALGYILGGHLGEVYSWRSAFLIVGLPGLLMILLCLTMEEPERGAADGLLKSNLSINSSQANKLGLRETYISLLRNKQFVTAVLGLTANGFAFGALAVWGPTFLNRIDKLPLGLANKLFGLTLIPSALLGTLTGGYLGDYSLKFTKKSYFLISSAGMLTSVPFLMTAILARNPVVYWPAIFFTAFFVTFALVLNAAIMNSVHPLIRSSAMSTSVFITHILGDAVSPLMIGWISDLSNLKTAIMLIPIILAVGAGILIWGAKISSFEEEVF
jgi:MFS transporter, Spinster family, sphingosine-1-phosphate transporter